MPEIKDYVCRACWRQYDAQELPGGGKMKCVCKSREGYAPTDGWEDSWAPTRSRVFRECADAAAWAPGHWLESVAADDLVDKGLLEVVRTPVDERSYRLSYAGRAMADALSDDRIPEDVAHWYGAGVSVVSMLKDCLAPIQDTLRDVTHPGSDEAVAAAERSALLLEQLDGLLQRARDRMSGVAPYAHEPTPPLSRTK